MPEEFFFHDFPGGSVFKKENEKLLIFLWGDGLGLGGARARAPGPRGPGPRAQRASRAQSIAELYIFSVFVPTYTPYTQKRRYNLKKQVILRNTLTRKIIQ